jgi:hypothetical protein
MPQEYMQLDVSMEATTVKTVTGMELKDWWYQRCDALINARFRVLIQLWTSVHHQRGSFVDQLAEDSLDEPKEQLLAPFKLNVTAEEAQLVMAEMDTNRDGSVNREEAQQWWEQYSDEL